MTVYLVTEYLRSTVKVEANSVREAEELASQMDPADWEVDVAEYDTVEVEQ